MVHNVDMDEPTESYSAEIAVPAPLGELERLSGVLLGDMTPEEHDAVKRAVVATKAAGSSWNRMQELWPMLNLTTMRAWWREARYAPVDTRPGAVERGRQRQAGEIRAVIAMTFERLEALQEDMGREGLETDTDRFTKLTNTLAIFQKREAALMGWDAPVRMELDQRVKIDWAPELESLVGELAGGGLLQTDAGEILDGEIVDD